MAQAGAYRRRVHIQQQVAVKDSTGGIVPTWKTIWPDVPCSILPYRPKEIFEAQQVNSQLTWKIGFRWRPDLDASMRLVEFPRSNNPTIYNVEGVMPDATNRREIALLCRTRDQEGFKTDGQ